MRGGVIALHEGGIEQVPQGALIAGLEADTARRAHGGGGRGDGGLLGEVLLLGGGPIQHHHGSGDFSEAANLQLLGGIGALQHRARGIIHNGVGGRGRSGGAGGRESQQQRTGKQGAQKEHGDGKLVGQAS